MSAKIPADGQKDLTFFALFSLTFGSMMGSGVFDIPQNMSHRSGALAVAIHWGIVAVGIIALAWVFVFLSNRRPDIQSGIYGYAKYGFGDYVGFTSAWGYYLNALLGNASYLIYIFATLGNFFTGFGNGKTAGATFPSFLCESMLIWIVTALILKGVREASVVNTMITTVKLTALATLILVFLYGFKTSVLAVNMSTTNPELGSMLNQIKSTMLVTVWDFLGLEAACIYALYAKSMRDVGRATMLAVVVVLLIDTLLSMLPFGILPTATVQSLSTPSTQYNFSFGYTCNQEHQFIWGGNNLQLMAPLTWQINKTISITGYAAYSYQWQSLIGTAPGTLWGGGNINLSF